MAITLKTMKSFVPSYNAKYRKRDGGNKDFFISVIPARFLTKLLKVVILVLFLSAAFIIGNFIWLVLKQYAILVSTEVPSKQEITYDSLQQSVHFDAHKGVKKIQADRKIKVSSGCKNSKEPKFLSAHQKKTTYNRIFVDHHHKYAYCSVPKAACTKWKQIVLKSSEIGMYEDQDIGSIFPHYDQQFKRLSDLDAIKAMQVLNRYFTFTFVRDPLVRMVSAWRDKFQHHPRENRSDYIHFHHEFGRNIMKRFRRGGFTAEELERGFPISFTEYIDYITSFSNPEEMNEHWIPSTTLCRPCHVDYDFIGKFEYQKMESEFLVENALYLERYVPPDFFKDAGEESREEARKLLAGIPERKKRILVELYQDDAELFGYDLEEFLGPTRLSKA